MKNKRRILARRAQQAHGGGSMTHPLEVDHSRQAAKPDARPADVEAYDIAPVSFFTLDRQGRICELNEQGANLLDFPASWLLGRAFVVFIARQDVNTFLDLLRECTRHPAPRVINVDMYISGKTVPVQMSLATSSSNDSITHRLTVVDRTQIQNTEAILQESLSNWYSLVHNAPDTILTVEGGGRIAVINKPMWGYSVRALVGTNILNHVPEGERTKLKRCLEQAFRFNKHATCDITGVNGDSNRWFNFSIGPLQKAHTVGIQNVETTTLIIHEVSDHKRTEKDLRASGEQLRDFATRIEAAREEERTRVAREIHDELGQALTALKLDLTWVKGKTRGTYEVRKKMKEMIVHVDETIDRVRRISSELRPSVLDDLGLIPAIEWQVAEFRKRTRIRTELTSNAEELHLPKDAAAAVFRVVQEALTNIMRHAKATKVKISLNRTTSALRIGIVDNGIGMTRHQEMDSKSIGIIGMKERIARLGGEFNLFSGAKKGTRLEIVIPANYD